MKGRIEVEVEIEEDLKQLENELEASINHTTHLEGDVNVIGSSKADINDPEKRSKIHKDWYEEENYE